MIKYCNMKETIRIPVNNPDLTFDPNFPENRLTTREIFDTSPNFRSGKFQYFLAVASFYLISSVLRLN